MNDAEKFKRMPRVIRFEIAPKSIAAVVLTIAALWLLGQLGPILLVVVCALILVGTLNPFVEWLEEHRVKRVWSITLVFLVCALLGSLIGLVIFPPLWDQVTQITANLPAIQAKVADQMRAHSLTAPLSIYVKNFGSGKSTGVNVTAAVAVSMTVLEGLGYAASTIVLAIYLMADHERMRGVLYAVVPRRYHVRLARILLNLEPIVGGYMRGQVITSLAIGLFSFTLLSLCGIPNALALAAFAAITDVVPFIGGLMATTPAALAALSRGTGTATLVLMSMVAYQEFESRILIPRVYGRVLRLPSAAVVVSLLIGGKLGGIIGALLALPLAAALFMLIEELRVELPGDDEDDAALRHQDALAEKAYAAQSAGASPQEAGAVAAHIVEDQSKRNK